VTITWRDLGFVSISMWDDGRRFFRIDQQPCIPPKRRFTLTWIHQPSIKKHAKQHTLRQQRDIRTIQEAKQLAEQWFQDS
jgi:hypothetical protein